jgi:hypothetical protein
MTPGKLNSEGNAAPAQTRLVKKYELCPVTPAWYDPDIGLGI